MKSSYDLQGVVNRHNFRAGRTVFTDTLKTICKCHGPTGTCSIKTCMKTTSGLRVIGNTIKTMFKNAKRVEPENERRSKLKLVLVDVRKDVTDKSSTRVRASPAKSELTYTEVSPSFCDSDVTLGIPGVFGRICSKDPSHANSCRNLCCGKGYDQFLVTEETDCECKFLWCCSVRCKKCSQRKLVTRCK
ncbi:protein Wnt-7c-like [Dendronephthya gigantea]|uniref:protein Wnt-7c-like n=1 Tax=Dendronephthya gigantea TaxID=151771 RepID=UPI00106CBE62|nr:protein Wnt-7c-like [Dendronephthya gigantea]